MYLVKIPLIFKSGKKRLFLYHILTPKGQSVPQFVVQYHKKHFITICVTIDYENFCDRTRITTKTASTIARGLSFLYPPSQSFCG